MICPSCSKDIPEGSPRCPSCGWIAPSTAAQNPQWSARPPTWMWLASGCGCLAALGLIAGIVALVVWLASRG